MIARNELSDLGHYARAIFKNRKNTAFQSQKVLAPVLFAHKLTLPS
jgi:hypothetical protein